MQRCSIRMTSMPEPVRRKNINMHRGRNQYPKRALAGDAFFRRPLNASHPRGVNQSRIKRATHWRATKVMSWEERALLPKLIHKVLQNVSAQTHVDQSKG